MNTVKRWTTDLIEHNQLRNKPRLFDQITEQVRSGSTEEEEDRSPNPRSNASSRPNSVNIWILGIMLWVFWSKTLRTGR